MGRSLKPLKVDKVHLPPYGIAAQVFLDRNENTFFAEYAGQRVEDATASGCVKKARKLLQDSLALKWQQVIIIGRSTDSWQGQGLEFCAEREEVALSPGSGCIKRAFRTDDDDPEPEPLHPVDEEHASDPNWGAQWRSYDFPETNKHRVVLPYSKEAWRTVLAIKQAIETTRAKIDELLASADLEQRLVSGNLQLLALPPASEPEPETDAGRRKRRRAKQ